MVPVAVGEPVHPGTIRERIPGSTRAAPEMPANLTLGGPEGTTLFITARTALYAVDMTVGGQ